MRYVEVQVKAKNHAREVMAVVEPGSRIRMGDKLTIGGGGRVRKHKKGEQLMGVALQGSFVPEGCLEVWDERPGLR